MSFVVEPIVLCNNGDYLHFTVAKVAPINLGKPLDTLSKMSTFLAVVETGSFAAAARRVGMTRSAVSRHVAKLEEALGTTLIVRTTRRSHLTSVGEAYYLRCCEVLRLAEEAEREAQGKAMEVSGTLRLVAPLLLHQILSSIIAEVLKDHPDLNIDVGFSDASTNLVDEGIDLAIRIGPSNDSTLTAIKLAPVRYVVCASPTYLAEHATPEKPADLADHRWISFSPLPAATTWTFTKNRRSYVVRVSRVLATNASITLRDALLADIGVTTIPRFYVEDALSSGQLVQLLPEYDIAESGIYGIYPQQQSLAAKTHTFLDAAKAKFVIEPAFRGIVN